MNRSLALFGALVVTAALAVGAPVAAATGTPPPTPTPRANAELGPGGSGPQSGCDPIDPAACLLPFPNDYFTVPDRSTATGRRVAFSPGMMPQNVAGTPIDPTEWNRNDGFSPGTPILTRVPGVDLKKTGAAPITDIGRSLDEDAPIVLLNARTGKRTPYWAELDANATDPARQALIIRPAANLAEGTRYIVALRSMRDRTGRLIPAGPAFAAYADSRNGHGKVDERRLGQMRDIFAKLERAGVERRDLYLAWDFTVASERGLSERMLHIRDDAFRQLGDTDLSDKSVKGRSPRFTVDSVQDFGQCGTDGCGQGENDQVARRVAGTIFVPCYLDETNCPTGATFNYSKGSSLPTQIPGNERAANFICNIPRSAVSGERIRKAHPSLYGHGLLGSADEVDSGKLYTIGDDNGIMFCATDWIGLARDDRATAPETYRDISKFPTAADRGQQGMLDFLYLGRAMIHPDGFAADPAFRFEKKGRSESVIDTRELLYMGGSQGGIMGGALTAVAPDFTKAVLGVPGMNYSLQLNRSVDFAPFQTIFDQNYPDKLDQQVIFGLLQMLWDRSEASGYAHHMTTDTYRDTPEHKVLMLVSYGDHQVSTWASAVEARTIGAHIRTPVLDPGRSQEKTPFWGIPEIKRSPYRGPATITVWDIGPLRTVDGQVKGTPPPPVENVPNDEGVDPHGPDATETAAGQEQLATFLLDGVVVDTCGNRPCYLDGWTGP
ncbi:hypothetical protein [Streptosporangium sp. 'caverna']|uniref:hypothetical protein n=1 Tax=Streptosporangium sp. 'caverna' TaxID=2202249 RepID=UPI000D7DC7DA|nr:hypothetical protein [Streptosporangium sp. 'caverna']AWS45055.1 hypothetical protein DKM19_30825 [Streptosporangium sp. 'caverna']